MPVWLMAFKAGDRVHVAQLGKGIVREVRRGGRCVVEIKGRAVLIGVGQLTALTTGKSGGRQPDTAPPPEAPAAARRGHAAATIDLHGMTAAEAVVALDAFLNEAILAGLPAVQVIHGRSGGRIRAAVHQRLGGMPVVRNFRIDPANAGVTIVTL